MIVQLRRRPQCDLGEAREFAIAALSATLGDVGRNGRRRAQDLRSQSWIATDGCHSEGEIHVEREAMGLLPNEQFAEITHWSKLVPTAPTGSSKHRASNRVPALPGDAHPRTFSTANSR